MLQTETHMGRRLAGKVVVVAGASTGIGRTTALRLANEGASVVVGSPAGEQVLIDSLVEEITHAGGAALGQPFDATDDASIRTLVYSAASRFGGIDAVHANFADVKVVLRDSDAASVTDEVLERTLDVDLKGMVRITRAAIPLLLERGGGTMIYTSSIAATVGAPVAPCYAIAKAGVNALARHVASRWGKENIRANAIMPGMVLVPERELSPEEMAGATSATRSPRLGRPEDIAAMVAMLASEDGSWINGQSIAVDGGWTLS